MGIIMNSKGSVYAMKVLIMKLVVWLGWLSCVAVGQLEVSEAVTGFVNFPEVGISCIGNLAVFITSISKGRLDLEMGARDVLASLRGPKLHDIKNSKNSSVGLTTCETEKYGEASVVMLSCNRLDSTMKQFMKYNSNAHDVQSILLSGRAQGITCNHGGVQTICKCIVFDDVKEITVLLARRMPGTLKLLPASLECLLPCVGCLTNDCHGFKERMLYEERDPQQPDATYTERKPEEGFIPPPVSEMLDMLDDCETQKGRTCICIPVCRPEKDEWTKLLTKSFRTKDNEDRKVRAMASDAMENYTAQEPKDTRMAWTRGRKNLRKGLKVEFRTPSLLLPRLTEILINLLLVGWFRVDGFSTSMVARKAVKIYVVGSKESGFAANAFLTTALLKSYKDTGSGDINSTENDTHICQLLTFRGPLLNLRTLSLIAGTVNLLCSIFWAVFMAFEGSHGKWYDIHYVKPSIPRVALIIVAIGVALGMDCLHFYLYWRDRKDGKKDIPANASEKPTNAPPIMHKAPPIMPVCAVIVVEIMCIASGSVVLGVLGKKPFKKWVSSVVQALVWVKWGIGSYLLGELHSETNSEYNWRSGILVYSSSFFLNFMLAAVRCHWRYSPQI